MGTIVDTQGSVTKHAEDGQRTAKRRKLDVGVGKKAIQGLLGGYGSDDEDPGEGEEGGIMSMFGEYAANDEDGGGSDVGDLEEDEGANINLDPAALLELVWRAQALDSQAGDEDLVDWGDSDEGESV